MEGIDFSGSESGVHLGSDHALKVSLTGVVDKPLRRKCDKEWGGVNDLT